MVPRTEDLKGALVAVGVPHAAIHAGTDWCTATRAAVDREYLQLVVDNADQLMASGTYGVVTQGYPCGCLVAAVVTTDSRHAGKLTKVEHRPFIAHVCPPKQATDRQGG